MPIGFLFMGHELEHAQAALELCKKKIGLLKEVAHIAKWGVFTEITFFGSNFLGQ